MIDGKAESVFLAIACQLDHRGNMTEFGRLFKTLEIGGEFRRFPADVRIGQPEECGRIAHDAGGFDGLLIPRGRFFRP